MLNKFINWYFEKLKKWYLPLFIVFLVVSLFLTYLGSKIEMKSDFIDLLPEKNQTMKNMKKVFNLFGGEGFVILTLEYKHEFYGVDSSLHNYEKEIGKVQDKIKFWDPYDKKSTKEYVPLIKRFLAYLSSRARRDFKAFFVNHAEKLKTKKAKRINKWILNQADISVKLANDLYAAMPKDNNMSYEEMIKYLQKKLKISELNEIFNHLSSSVSRIKSIIKEVKRRIKSEFINQEPMRKATDEIVKKLSSSKITKDIRYINYRNPVKWKKDNFFYLINYRDLVDLHRELKKIHLSAVRIIGSDKFQRIRDIIGKYSVSIGKKSEKDENKATNKDNVAKQSSASKQNDVKTENDEKKYEYRFNGFGDMLLILIKPGGRSTDLDFSKKVLKNIQRTVRDINPTKYDSKIVYGLTGRYVKKVEDAEILSKDIQFTSILAVLIIMIVVFIYFRKLRAIFATMIPLFTGLGTAIGLIYIAVGYFNIITGFIVAILSGLGIDFSIHMLARYYEERRDGRDVISSLKTVFLTTLKATFTAATTTAFAFLCLIITEFRGFSQFGYTIFLGLILIIVAMFITFPCILIISEKIKPIDIEKLKKERKKSLSGLRGKKFPYPYTIAAVIIILIIISIFFPPKFNFNFSSLRSTEKVNFAKTKISQTGEKSAKYSEESSNVLEKRISRSYNVSLWPSILYVADMKTCRKIEKMLTLRAQYSSELRAKLRGYNFMRFLKNVYNNPDKFKESNLNSEVILYLNKIKNDTSIRILSRYFKELQKPRFKKNKALIKNFFKKLKYKLIINYVESYLNNIAISISSSAPNINSSTSNEKVYSENEEQFNLSVPDEKEQIRTMLSDFDKKILKRFFDALIENDKNLFSKYIAKPYDYVKIFKNIDKILKLLSKSKNISSAVFSFFHSIKKSIQIKKEDINEFVSTKKTINSFQEFIENKFNFLHILEEGYYSFQQYYNSGITDLFEDFINQSLKNRNADLSKDINIDLFKSLKRPYKLNAISESLRIIFEDIDSITRYLPNDQGQRKVVIKKIAKILNDGKFIKRVKDKDDKRLVDEAKDIAKNLRGVKYKDIPDEITTRFQPGKSQKGQFIFIYPTTEANMSGNTSIQAYTRYLKSITSPTDKKALFASETVIFAEILRILAEDGWLILTLTMLSIILILLFDFKSLKALLFTNLPLIGGTILMFLFMRIFNVKINYLNAAILPVILGVAIDEGVHIYHRYLEEGKKNIWFIVRTTGVAVFMADFTTAIGFTALMFANYRGLRTMGHLAFIGIMTAFIVAVTLLPAILQILENRKERKNTHKA